MKRLAVRRWGWLAVAAIALGGCGGAGGIDEFFSGGEPFAGGSGDGREDGGGGGMGAGGSMGTGGSGDQIQAGQLTAGDWDDNRNFDHYRRFVSEQAQTATLPLLPTDRVVVMITDVYGAPLRNARVVVSDAQGTGLVTLVTGSNGLTLFYPSQDGESATYTITASAQGYTMQGTFSPTVATWTLAIPGPVPTATTALDVAFIIDTTGSMGDEISYLQAELAAVINTLVSDHGQLDIRYGLVLYRDRSDAYEVQSYEFTSSVGQFLADLGDASASGGGDYPESVAEGVEAGMFLDWRSSDAVRIAFLVGDAPPQAGRQTSTADGAITARARGIHIYPIASSGVDTLTELVFRQLAQFSLGRYLFLTDDSGIGGSHAEPTIPCYHVQLLNRLLGRVLESEVAGTWIFPEAADIIRSAGDPQSGICTVGENTYNL